MDLNQKIDELFEKSIEIIVESKKLRSDVVKSAKMIINSLEKNGKVIAFGNGGSASDCQHFVAEFIGKFQKNRKSLPAIAFTTDTSIITAIGNDYGFEMIFERQVEALVKKNDVVFAISTSGKSENVIRGVKAAKKKNAKIISLTGNSSNKLSNLSDISINVPSNSTPRIQEVHRLILHYICEIVEDNIKK